VKRQEKGTVDWPAIPNRGEEAGKGNSGLSSVPEIRVQQEKSAP